MEIVGLARSRRSCRPDPFNMHAAMTTSGAVALRSFLDSETDYDTVITMPSGHQWAEQIRRMTDMNDAVNNAIIINIIDNRPTFIQIYHLNYITPG